jgi:hypothetical protein
MTTEHRIKVRDLPPTAVRLTPEVRHALAREATINNRSLHGEIVFRLQQSLQPPSFTGSPAAESVGTYEVRSDVERTMLAFYRRLSAEKQLALLSLLKP